MCLKALRTLREGRNTNPAHKDAFNLLISDLRKKNPQWDRKSVDDLLGKSKRILFEKCKYGKMLTLQFISGHI
jgi:hypothetical protein